MVHMPHESDDRRTWMQFFLWRRYRNWGFLHHWLRLMNSTTFLPFFDLENKTVFFADCGRYVRFDRVIDGSEDIHLHQITNQLKWLDTDALSKLADDNRRVDMNRFIVGYYRRFFAWGGRRGFGRLCFGRRLGFGLNWLRNCRRPDL